VYQGAISSGCLGLQEVMVHSLKTRCQRAPLEWLFIRVPWIDQGLAVDHGARVHLLMGAAVYQGAMEHLGNGCVPGFQESNQGPAVFQSLKEYLCSYGLCTKVTMFKGAFGHI